MKFGASSWFYYKEIRQIMYAHNVTMRRFCVTIVATEKQAVLHIRYVFIALVIQNAKRMRRIIVPSVACLSV